MGIDRVRVLVVDDNVLVGRDLRLMLDTRSFEVIVAEGAGRTLAADAMTKAGISRPHVAVIDLDLCGGSSAPDGLDLMNDLRSAGLVLYSGHLRVSIVNQAKQQSKCQVVDKGDDSPSKLIEAIQTAAADVCGFGRRFAVTYSPEWHPSQIIETLFGPGSGIPDDAIETVIWQLLQQECDEGTEIHRVDLETMEGSVHSVQSVSRGRSVLFKAFRKGRIKPLILKLSSAQSAEREFGHYREHVVDNIGGVFYAAIRGKPAHFWNVGGLAYQFLGGRIEDLESLATCYSVSETSDRVLTPLRHFFEEAWRGLYDKTEDCEDSLYEVYDTWLRLSEKLAANKDLRQPVSFPGIEGIELPNPLAWVQEHGPLSSHIHSAKVAPTHGDLHADNLLVDRDHAWAIDFERTGWGHWLRDLAELEVDILTRLMSLPKEGASEWFGKLAIALAEPRSFSTKLRPLPDQPTHHGLAKAIEVIGGLRRIANRTVNCTDFREYLWALLFDAVFVAMLPGQPAEQKRQALLLGAVLCDRLEHWRGEWLLQKQVFLWEREEESQ